jgi:uncharacterized protein (DUF58 family)
MGQLTLLDDQLVAKVKGIQLRAKHLVNSSFAGEYLSAFKGEGIEFEEVREYQAGDDIRTIDWNVTARAGKPYIKTYRDERELTVMFLVDVSASGHFGSGKKFKQEVAAEITALLAYTALRNNDKVGLIIFSDHVEHYIPPKKGRGHVWRLIRDILSYQSNSTQTDLALPLDYLNRVVKRKAITFMISDFQGDAITDQMRVSCKRHDLIAISVADPREKSLPSVGYLELEDAESGEVMLVNTSDRGFLSRFRKLAKKRDRSLAFEFRKLGMDYIEVTTDDSYLEPILKFFHQREQRLRS